MSLKKFDYIIDSISNVKKEVDVWFVAAGPYAKVFCNHIKSINGIGIDIGSAMDTWVGEYHSRKYLRELNDNL